MDVDPGKRPVGEEIKDKAMRLVSLLVFAVLPLLQRPVVGLYLPCAGLLRDDSD